MKINQLPLYSTIQNIDEVDSQLRRLNLHDWEQEFGQIPEDATQFWILVRNYNNEDSFPYKDLADHALNCLTIVASNAFVECIFSKVTYLKSKLRNCLKVELLDALLTLKTTLQESTFLNLHYQFKIWVDIIFNTRIKLQN